MHWGCYYATALDIEVDPQRCCQFITAVPTYYKAVREGGGVYVCVFMCVFITVCDYYCSTYSRVSMLKLSLIEFVDDPKSREYVSRQIIKFDLRPK